jgi:hypothetical protein
MHCVIKVTVMKKGNWLRAWEWVRVVFGTGHLDRFVLFEIKYLFAIYYNVWNVIEHDRFHTHAFPAISFGIKGQYYEQQIKDGIIVKRLYKAPWFRFISRNNNHRMLNSSKNAISITIAGPWDCMWSETFLDGTKRILTWGKNVVLSNHETNTK